MMDRKPMPREPVIIINGRLLTEAQAMTLRVATADFANMLEQDPGLLGDDEHAKLMHAAYSAHAETVLAIMVTFL